MKKSKLIAVLMLLLTPALTFASEADLVIPDAIKSQNVLYWGFLITILGMLFGLYQFIKVKKLKAHKLGRLIQRHKHDFEQTSEACLASTINSLWRQLFLPLFCNIFLIA